LTRINDHPFKIKEDAPAGKNSLRAFRIMKGTHGPALERIWGKATVSGTVPENRPLFHYLSSAIGSGKSR
jgi:hypothetical protein